MDNQEHLPGIRARMINTPRLKTAVLSCGDEKGQAILFIHGNFSAASYFEELMLAAPDNYHCIAPDLRGYGYTENKVIDATRGAEDWAEDLLALLDTLGIASAHIVGWSLGGAVVLQLAAMRPEQVMSLTLIAPVSPYGFGGTRGDKGIANYNDYAGTGGGIVAPEFAERIARQDRSSDDVLSPRNVIKNTFFFQPPGSWREEALLSASLAQRTGKNAYPGDKTVSPNWPGVAPGRCGAINAVSPKYLSLDDFLCVHPQPEVLWIRGDRDQIVANYSFSDAAVLGKEGIIPDWPGEQICPPQPMVDQTRHFLDRYQKNGGSYSEKILFGVGHAPFMEAPEEFLKLFSSFLATTS